MRREPSYKAGMRISGPSPFMISQVATRPGASGPQKLDSFPASPASTPTASTPSASPTTGAKGALSVDMLMTIAGAEGGQEQRKRLVKDAEQGLQFLEGIHTDALKGQSDPQKLEQLSAWLSNQEAASDPSVASIMKDIDLRARVELAKRDVSSAAA